MTREYSRIVIVAGSTELQTGDAHPVTSFPLHVTLLPPFEASSESAVADAVSRLARDLAPFDVVGSRHGGFGPNGDIRVTVIEDERVVQLHHRLRREARADDWRAIELDYSDAGFRPHVTATADAQLDIGARFVLDRFAVVRLEPVPTITSVSILSGPVQPHRDSVTAP